MLENFSLPSFCKHRPIARVYEKFQPKEAERREPTADPGRVVFSFVLEIARRKVAISIHAIKGSITTSCPQAIGESAKKTPDAEDRPGAASKFQFPNYADVAARAGKIASCWPDR